MPYRNYATLCVAMISVDLILGYAREFFTVRSLVLTFALSILVTGFIRLFSRMQETLTLRAILVYHTRLVSQQGNRLDLR